MDRELRELHRGAQESRKRQADTNPHLVTMTCRGCRKSINMPETRAEFITERDRNFFCDACQEVDELNDLLKDQLMNLDKVRSAGYKKGRRGATANIKGEWEDIPEHLFRLAERFDLTVVWRSTGNTGLYVTTHVELANDERLQQIEDYCEKYDDMFRVLE